MKNNHHPSTSLICIIGTVLMLSCGNQSQNTEANSKSIKADNDFNQALREQLVDINGENLKAEQKQNQIEDAPQLVSDYSWMDGDWHLSSTIYDPHVGKIKVNIKLEINTDNHTMVMIDNSGFNDVRGKFTIDESDNTITCNDTYVKFDPNKQLFYEEDHGRKDYYHKTENVLKKQIEQSERRGLPLTDTKGLDLSGTLIGQNHTIGYTNSENPHISVSVKKKNNQEGYWSCSWIYNFRFTAYGEINYNRETSYPSNTFTIPGKIRLGDYEWRGEIASSYDYSRPKSCFIDKLVWVTRVQITPPENVKKIVFEDGYIENALINLNHPSNHREIHLPKSIKDFELFVASYLASDVLIFLPCQEPWEIIDGKRVPLFSGKENHTSINDKFVFIVPKGSVEEYRKIERFKNVRIFTSIEEYESKQ